MKPVNGFRIFVVLLTFSLLSGTLAASGAGVIRNVTVCLEEGRYGGWPANHGIWSWGNEILVGFELGYYMASEERHAIDRSRFREHLLAHSQDGGETWTIERPGILSHPSRKKK